MKLTVKALSLLLCICLLIPTGVGYVLAEAPASSEPELSQAPFFDAAEGTERFDATLDLDTVPEIIGADTAHKLGHVRRLYTAEKDLNTVYFKNADDTVTAYYFNHPVKYIDTDGSVKDITLDIEKKSGGGYGSKGGYASTVFAEKMTDGITLSGEGVSITLLPHVKESTAEITPIKPGTSVMSSTAQKVPEAKADAAGKKISYAYDAKTSYEYSLTYSGFKEDIVVSEYTGQTTYTFTLKTGGLVLAEDEGGFYLLDEKGTEKGRLGRIIVFTADMKNNTFGSMSAKTLTEGEEYLLTIQLDAEYLRDERTKYPITIDPTIELTYESNSAGIHDIVINDKDELSGTDGEISAGKWGSDNSVSRILMKFPGLNLSDVPSADSIISAKVYMKDLMCQHEYLTLECYPFTGNEWNESNATWTNVGQPSTFTGLLDSHEISYFEGVDLETPHVYEFDITGAVRGWVDGTYDQDKGIIFKAAADHEADPTHNYKTFASFQRATNKPYVVGVYEDFIPRVEFTLDHMNCYPQEQLDLSFSVETVPEDATVTYTQLYPHFATVNSSTGMFNAQYPGTVPVRASITVNGRTYSDTAYVHVMLQSGVYEITNLFTNTNLDASYGKIYGSVQATHWYADGTLKQLWRVKYIGEGQYTIRPMHNPNMLLTGTQSNVYVAENSITNESLLADTLYAWKLSYSYYEGCYFIENANPSYGESIALIPSTEENNYSTLLSSNYLTEEFAWEFTSVPFTPRILVYDTETQEIVENIAIEILLGSYNTLEDFDLKVVFSAVDFNHDYTLSSASSNITIKRDKVLQGLSLGESSVTINCSNVTTVINVSVTLNGVLYISNYTNNLFITYDTSVCLADIDTTANYEWEIESLGNDYYTIKNVQNNLYLAVTTTYDEFGSNVTMLENTDANYDRIKWRITVPLWGNSFFIAPYIWSNNDMLLVSDGGELRVRENGTALSRNTWEFYPQGTSAMLVGIKEVNYDRFSCYSSVMKKLYYQGYMNFNLFHTDNLSKSLWKNNVKKCEIYVSRSHGGKDTTDQESFVKLGTENLFATYLYDFETSSVNTDLSNVELMLFVGCKTSYYPDTSITDAAVAAGADCAVGFTNNIDWVNANRWTQKFFSYYSQGYSIEDAVSMASSYMDSEYNAYMNAVVDRR